MFIQAEISITFFFRAQNFKKFKKLTTEIRKQTLKKFLKREKMKQPSLSKYETNQVHLDLDILVVNDWSMVENCRLSEI